MQCTYTGSPYIMAANPPQFTDLV